MTHELFECLEALCDIYDWSKHGTKCKAYYVLCKYELLRIKAAFVPAVDYDRLAELRKNVKA